MNDLKSPHGVLLLDKPSGFSSFSMVAILRKRIGERCIGHGGTLDPIATGLLILLIGRAWTKQSNHFLHHTKSYEVVVKLGESTDTYDREGKILNQSSHVPSQTEIQEALSNFQGEYLQIPPMFSAKKVQGKRLYQLARQGVVVKRTPIPVQIETRFQRYHYPWLHLHIVGTKGTYVRSIVHDLGEKLHTYAHVHELRRIESGSFSVNDAMDFSLFTTLSREKVLPFLIFPECKGF